MTPSDVVELFGKEMAEWAKHAALALFDGESEIMRARGLILIDTKYEFSSAWTAMARFMSSTKSTLWTHPASVAWRDGKKITPCRHRHGHRKVHHIGQPLLKFSQSSKSKNSPNSTFEMRCWI